MHSSTHFIVLLGYVNEIIVVGNDLDSIIVLKTFLDQKFKIKDLGDVKFFLGLEVARSSKGIILNKRKYVLDI